MSLGVTSTHSSSRMYSSAWSSESVRGGMSRTVESADAAPMPLLLDEWKKTTAVVAPLLAEWEKVKAGPR